MSAWNGWYHVTGNSYGTWLPGNPRGWRSRHHRVHVDGDYKSPPPAGTHDGLWSHAQQTMASPAVRLSPDARRLACDVMVENLRKLGAEVCAFSVDDHHFHGLVRFGAVARPMRQSVPQVKRDLPLKDARRTGVMNARTCIGIAKKASARALAAKGLVAPGGVWAVRSRCAPVQNREHYVRVARYIADHANRGTAVYVVGENGPQDLAQG